MLHLLALQRPVNQIKVCNRLNLQQFLITTHSSQQSPRASCYENFVNYSPSLEFHRHTDVMMMM